MFIIMAMSFFSRDLTHGPDQGSHYLKTVVRLMDLGKVGRKERKWS